MSQRTNSLATVVAKLFANEYTVKMDALRRSVRVEEALKSWPPLSREELHPFDRTPLDFQLTSAFDTKTFKWLKWLKAKDLDAGSDWHLVTIEPTSPLTHVEDWLWALPSKSEALGSILENMDQVRAEPLMLTTSATGALIIEGAPGPIATISPIVFSPMDPEIEARGVRCLRHLRLGDHASLVAKQLRKIEGLANIDCGTADAQTRSNQIDCNRQCIDVSCANLCSSFLNALQPYVIQPIKQSLAQELVAVYFGFDNWNTFRGLEKRRHTAVHQVHRVSNIQVLSEYEDEYQEHTFHRTLASGIVGFGRAMKLHGNNRPVNVCTQYHLNLDNVEMRQNSLERLKDFPERVPCQAIEMKHLLRPEVDPHYLHLATCMLATDNLEQAIKEYFFTGLDPLSRMKKIDSRFGVRAEDHLVLGSWVFSLHRRIPCPFIIAERIENVGKYDHRHQITVDQHKAAIVASDGGYWMATDWDRQPTFFLPGLRTEDVEKLENAFLKPENWLYDRGALYHE